MLASDQLPLVAFAAAALLPPLVVPLASRSRRRALLRLGEVHWTELARVRWLALMALNGASAASIFGAALVAWILVGAGGPWGRLIVLGCFVVAAASSILVGTPLVRALPGALPVQVSRTRLLFAKLFLFRGSFLASIVALALVPFDARSPWTAAVVAGLVVFILWYLKWGALAVPRWMGVVTDAEEGLRGTVAASAARRGLASVPVYVLEQSEANAAALLFGPAVLATRGILETLEGPELDAVLDHEMAHLAEGRARRWAFGLAGFVLVPVVVALPVAATFGSVWGLGVALGVPVIQAVSGRMARSLEQRADEGAHEVETDEGVYARALEALHRRNLTPATLAKGVDPHGSLYDRMLAAGVQPDFERPAPPSVQRGLRFGLLVLLIALAGGAAVLRAEVEPRAEPASVEHR